MVSPLLFCFYGCRLTACFPVAAVAVTRTVQILCVLIFFLVNVVATIVLGAGLGGVLLVAGAAVFGAATFRVRTRLIVALVIVCHCFSF